MQTALNWFEEHIRKPSEPRMPPQNGKMKDVCRFWAAL